MCNIEDMNHNCFYVLLFICPSCMKKSHKYVELSPGSDGGHSCHSQCRPALA